MRVHVVQSKRAPRVLRAREVQGRRPCVRGGRALWLSRLAETAACTHVDVHGGSWHWSCLSGFGVYRPRCQVVGDRRRWLGASMGGMRTSCVRRSVCLFSYGGTAACSSHREGAGVNLRAVGVPDRGTSCPSPLPSSLWGWSLCWCFVGAFGSRVSGRCGFLPSADGHQPAGDPGRGKSCAETGVGRDVRAAGAGRGGEPQGHSRVMGYSGQ